MATDQEMLIEAFRLFEENGRLRDSLKGLHDWYVDYAKTNNLHNKDGSPATFHELLVARRMLELTALADDAGYVGAAHGFLNARDTGQSLQRELGMRENIIKLLWEKQFEGSPWQHKFHLIRPDSLEADYGTLADKIIETVRADIESCFTLTDRRAPGGVDPAADDGSERFRRADGS